jgi:hypothetical protein
VFTTSRKVDKCKPLLLGSLSSGLGSITQSFGRVTVQARNAVEQTVGDLNSGDMDQFQGRLVNATSNAHAKGVETGQKMWSGLKAGAYTRPLLSST